MFLFNKKASAHFITANAVMKVTAIMARKTAIIWPVTVLKDFPFTIKACHHQEQQAKDNIMAFNLYFNSFVYQYNFYNSINYNVSVKSLN